MSAHPKYPELMGKTAVVTGGARGLGESHARALAENGVNVVIADLDLAQTEETARRISADFDGANRVVAAQADVAHPLAHHALAELATQEFGGLDIWINNAGIHPSATVKDISEEQLRDSFAINTFSVVYGAQAAVAAMGPSGGSIVNTASIAAYMARRERATYGVTKAAVEQFTKFLAVELAGDGIRVNALAPGFTRTEMTSWVHENPTLSATVVAGIPLGRIGSPEDVSDALLFLVSDSARYITGTTLAVDGGGRYR